MTQRAAFHVHFSRHIGSQVVEEVKIVNLGEVLSYEHCIQLHTTCSCRSSVRANGVAGVPLFLNTFIYIPHILDR